MLFPHSEVNVTVTKCPSLLTVREGFPGYPQTSQPVVVPFPIPTRTAASHEFERALAEKVKLSVWLTLPPFDTAIRKFSSAPSRAPSTAASRTR